MRRGEGSVHTPIVERVGLVATAEASRRLWPPQRQVERLRQLCIGSDGAELLAYLFAAWALEETRRDVHTDRSGTSDEI